ncbi:MAG: hypothetical protein E6J34_18110 [Chloroflexi bacterium]|nr:MAG: hypothetical protein E6J34_18110 [Chloroflexota bacterium]
MKNSGQSKVKNQAALAEQQESAAQQQPAQEEQQEAQSQQTPVENEQKSEQGTTAPASAPTRKKRKKVRQPTEAELMPRPSYWPFALALSLTLALLGFVSNPIVLAIGILLVIIAVSGWLLERR